MGHSFRIPKRALQIRAGWEIQADAQESKTATRYQALCMHITTGGEERIPQRRLNFVGTPSSRPKMIILHNAPARHRCPSLRNRPAISLRRRHSLGIAANARHRRQAHATADRTEGGIGRDRAADIKGPSASEKSAIIKSKRASERVRLPFSQQATTTGGLMLQAEPTMGPKNR